MEAGATVDALHEQLITCHSSNPLLNLVAVVALVENKNWEPPAKAAFIRFFPFSVYDHFSESFFDINTAESARAAFHGELCWLVHDLQVLHALDSSGISEECKQVFSILDNHIVNIFTQRILAQAHTGEHEEIDFKRETEGLLFELGKLCPHLAPKVSALLTSLNTTKERQSPGIIFYDELSRFYPDPIYPPDLNGEFLALEALQGFRVEAVLARINDVLREPITSRMEWSNPLGAAADQIRSTEVTDLRFTACDLLTTKKAQEVLFDLLSRVPDV
jgi:hypothetical protein